MACDNCEVTHPWNECQPVCPNCGIGLDSDVFRYRRAQRQDQDIDEELRELRKEYVAFLRTKLKEHK